jgi:hypothetical protein
MALVDEVLVTISRPVTAPAAAGLNCTVSVTVCLGFKVTGKLAPERVNPVPVKVAALIVTGAVPLEVRVTGWVDVEPTATLPKLKLAGLTVSCGVVAASPVPLRLTSVVAFEEELLLIASRPVTVPVAVGANRTRSVTVWRGFKVTGKLAPETVKPRPVTAAALMVTGAVPVEVSVRGCADEEPTVTLPKLRLATLAVNCGLVAAVPVPLRLTAALALAGELLLTLSLPVTAPVAVGLNRTVSVTD